MRIEPVAIRVMFWLAAAHAAAAPARAFDCVETKCPQMRTCAEAHYKLTVCGHTKRDADNDGIPCEALCGADMATYRARVKAQAPDAAEREPEQAAQSDNALSLIGTAEAADERAGDVAADATFSCAGKKTCKQMLSCAEAKFYLAQCGVKALDGDRDGTPCNSLCR